MTIACAPAASVLRPWPVSNTRARAASLAGPSSTRPPLASSRCASGRPIPCPPSTAQMRSGHRRAACRSWRQLRASVPNRPVARKISRQSPASIVTGSLSRVNPDDHPVHPAHLLTPRSSPCQPRTGNAIPGWANPPSATPRHGTRPRRTPEKNHAQHCGRAAARKRPRRAPHPSLRQPRAVMEDTNSRWWCEFVRSLCGRGRDAGGDRRAGGQW
jgi:hypothetical protein